MMRIKKHPILNALPNHRTVTIYFEGRKISAFAGEPVAAALVANGIKVLKITKKFHSPRGIFCAIGRCTDCMMKVDGKSNVRICLEKVCHDMRIEREKHEKT
ncbi:MAG: (2Fe-2S)-binding protein [Candidatus Omnitrophota bacterium]